MILNAFVIYTVINTININVCVAAVM